MRLYLVHKHWFKIVQQGWKFPSIHISLHNYLFVLSVVQTCKQESIQTQLREVHHTHPHFCETIARRSYHRNGCNCFHQTKAVMGGSWWNTGSLQAKLECLMTYIKLVKLEKRKAVSFQALNLSSALDFYVQILKANISQHGEGSNRELFP